MKGSVFRHELFALLFLLIQGSSAIAVFKPSDGYLDFANRIASDTMYARRGDPSAVMDFAIMASASADSLTNSIFALLWDSSHDTAIHREVRDRAIWALRWYQRDSVETLVESLLYEEDFELTSARVLAQWKSWAKPLDILVEHEDWVTLVLNDAPSVEDSLVAAENSGSPSGRMEAAYYLEEAFSYTGEKAKVAEEVLDDYVVNQQSYADTINLSRGVSYAYRFLGTDSVSMGSYVLPGVESSYKAIRVHAMQKMESLARNGLQAAINQLESLSTTSPFVDVRERAWLIYLTASNKSYDPYIPHEVGR